MKNFDFVFIGQIVLCLVIDAVLFIVFQDLSVAVMLGNLALILICCINFLALDNIPSYKEWAYRYIGNKHYEEEEGDEEEEQSYTDNNTRSYEDFKEKEREYNRQYQYRKSYNAAKSVSKFSQYCSILGINETDRFKSNSELLKEAKLNYKKLAMKWHPDMFATRPEYERNIAEEKFKNISEAYREVLNMLE